MYNISSHQAMPKTVDIYCE